MISTLTAAGNEAPTHRVAPTVLKLLEVPIPTDLDGKPLL